MKNVKTIWITFIREIFTAKILVRRLTVKYTYHEKFFVYSIWFAAFVWAIVDESKQEFIIKEESYLLYYELLVWTITYLPKISYHEPWSGK